MGDGSSPTPGTNQSISWMTPTSVARPQNSQSAILGTVGTKLRQQCKQFKSKTRKATLDSKSGHGVLTVNVITHQTFSPPQGRRDAAGAVDERQPAQDTAGHGRRQASHLRLRPHRPTEVRAAEVSHPRPLTASRIYAEYTTRTCRIYRAEFALLLHI